VLQIGALFTDCARLILQKSCTAKITLIPSYIWLILEEFLINLLVLRMMVPFGFGILEMIMWLSPDVFQPVAVLQFAYA